MSGQPEMTGQRYYAAENLRAAQSVLMELSQQLVVQRAQVENYRASDLAAARDTYAQLQQTRKNLVSVLAGARLLLMEVEETQLAAVAGQLQTGLQGFNLMSNTYRPVYDVLRGFAGKLPVEGTANAAVIGRLMNNVKMGYYPTDPDNISLILRGIRFPEGVTTNLLDPCCGCGKALRQKEDTILYRYPFSNVSSDGRICLGNNALPVYKDPARLHTLASYILRIPNNNDHYSEDNNRLHAAYRDLLEQMKNKTPTHYYTDVLVASGQTLKDFLNRR